LIELDVLASPRESSLHEQSVDIIVLLLFLGPSADADGDGCKPLVDMSDQITSDFLMVSWRNCLQSCGSAGESFNQGWLVRGYHLGDGSLDGLEAFPNVGN
jgi:hypothetical protein